MSCEQESGAARVLLVDDHRLLAESLAMALAAEGYEAEVADLLNRDRLIAHVRDVRPDLVLLDLDIGGAIGDGATLVRPFREAGARVLVVSGSADSYWSGSAVEQGALGVLDKCAPFESLLSSILAAARGEDVMAANERHRLIADVRRDRERQRRLLEPFERLTDREQRVLESLADGTPVAQMAQEWFVSEATVRTQVRGVLMKLGVNSQLEAVALAQRASWLSGRDKARTA